MPCTAIQASTKTIQEARARKQGTGRQEPLLWFLWEEMRKVGQASQAGLGLASLSDFSRFQDVVAIGCSCLIPGPGGDQDRGIVAWRVKDW